MIVEFSTRIWCVEGYRTTCVEVTAQVKGSPQAGAMDEDWKVHEIFKNYKEGVQMCMSSWGRREGILHDFSCPQSH